MTESRLKSDLANSEITIADLKQELQVKYKVAITSRLSDNYQFKTFVWKSSMCNLMSFACLLANLFPLYSYQQSFLK